MKPGHWLIFGSSFAGCAAALGIYLAAKGHSPGASTPLADAQRCQSGSSPKRHVFATAKSGSVRTTEKTASQTISAGSTATESRHKPGEPSPEFRIHGKPPVGRVADERAWFASAERVQREANRKLENLRETLELSPNQQQRIFDVLAQNSPSWQPGMLTGGSFGVGVGDSAKPSNSANQTSSESAWQTVENSSAVGNPDGEAAPAIAMADEILPILDADQQQALMEEELNRRAWWEEILPQLLAPELPSASGADDPAASLIGGGDTKVYEGPTGLLEE